MKNVETPETMVRFLEIITGRKPHVQIEGPSHARVMITRKCAQALFIEAANSGYAARMEWEKGKGIVLIRVVNS